VTLAVTPRFPVYQRILLSADSFCFSSTRSQIITQSPSARGTLAYSRRLKVKQNEKEGLSYKPVSPIKQRDKRIRMRLIHTRFPPRMPRPSLPLYHSDVFDNNVFSISIFLFRVLSPFTFAVEPMLQWELVKTSLNSLGEHGRNVFIVHSADQVHGHTGGKLGAGSGWLLQELIRGQDEHSVSMLVHQGKILDAVCTTYTYDREEYVRALTCTSTFLHFSHPILPHLSHPTLPHLSHPTLPHLSHPTFLHSSHPTFPHSSHS